MRKLAFASVLMCVTVISFGQFGGLGEKLLKGKDPLSALTKKTPITTSLADVNFDGSKDPDFGKDSAYSSMLNLQRTPNGGFILQPGFYNYQAQSYCLKAGTHGPGGGDGYMFAPPLGPMEDIVMAVVRNSVNKPELNQQHIQLLLWSIIARAKFDDLQNNIKVVATQLLTPKQLVKLNGGALGLVPDAATQKAMDAAPAPVKAVLQAEAQLRQMLTNPSSSFAEMERVAVLTGAAPLGEDSREVPSGRWSLHPDGYYVRYLPSGYSSTRVEIWVPQGSPAVGKEYDPATHIAVPGNTARQRLIQSGRVKQQ
jgi:hypothetical protein